MTKQFGVSQLAIIYHLRQSEITYKKTIIYQNQNEGDQQQFIAELAQQEPKQVVFLDENGSNDNERPAYGDQTTFWLHSSLKTIPMVYSFRRG